MERYVSTIAMVMEHVSIMFVNVGQGTVVMIVVHPLWKKDNVWSPF